MSDKMTPQKLDSVVRTITASTLALALVGALVYLAISEHGRVSAAAIEAVKAAALIVVGFYFGTHSANNTAALEEARLLRTADASEASAVRSEASARSHAKHSD